MGGLIKFLPFTYSAMLVGSLSLLATPWLTGFYSKDLIIELAFAQYNFSGTYAFVLGSITAGLTAFYSFRLISLVFLTVPNGPKKSYLSSHESELAVIIPLFILAIFSIFFGYVFSDLFVGMGTDFFGNSIFINPNNIAIIEAEVSLPLWVKLFPALLSFAGAAFAIVLYHYSPITLLELTENTLGRKIYFFLSGKYYFDSLYNSYVNSKGLQLGYSISKILDRGIIELIGPFGLSYTLNNSAQNISKLDDGIITTYSLYITLSLLSLLLIVFAPIIWNTPAVPAVRLGGQGDLSISIIYIASLLLVLSTPTQR